MTIMNILYFLFHGLCHQMASRSLSADGVTMPVCARCAGLYVALFFALPVYFLKTRRHAGWLPVSFHVAAGAAFAVFALDGLANLEFVAILNTPQWLRFAYGAVAGFFLAPYLALLLATTLGAREGGALCGWRDIAVLVGATALLTAATARPAGWLLTAESYAAGAGAVMLLGMAHTAIFTVAFNRRVALAAAIAVFTVSGQLAVFAVLREWTGL